MRWSDYGLPEVDAHASLRRSGHRRERVARREARRRKARWFFAPLACLGAVVVATQVFTDYIPSWSHFAILLTGFVMIVPWASTFDLLGTDR